MSSSQMKVAVNLGASAARTEISLNGEVVTGVSEFAVPKSAEDLGRAAHAYASWLQNALRLSVESGVDPAPLFMTPKHVAEVIFGGDVTLGTVVRWCRTGKTKLAYRIIEKFWIFPAHITKEDIEDPANMTLANLADGAGEYELFLALEVNKRSVKSTVTCNGVIINESSHRIGKSSAPMLDKLFKLAARLPKVAFQEIEGTIGEMYVTAQEIGVRLQKNPTLVSKWSCNGWVSSATKPLGGKYWIFPIDLKISEIDLQKKGLASKRYTAPNPRSPQVAGKPKRRIKQRSLPVRSDNPIIAPQTAF